MAKTLLLADDSVTIQKVVGISFASEDVDLITVDNGDDAIAKAREARPDIILSDVVMPGKNGYEVCEAIKSDPALAHIPVLLLTGTFEAFDEERASRCGAAGHVAKPFEAQTLVSRVAELLANPTPAPAASEPQPESAPATRSAVLGQTPIKTVSVPLPASGSDPVNDQSFEFFDDELAGSPQAAAGRVAPVDLDPTDSAFAFGDEDLGANAPGGDRTVAMLPEEPNSPLAPPPAPPRPEPPAAPAPPPADLLIKPPEAPAAPPADLLITPTETPASPREDRVAATPETPTSSDLLPPIESMDAADDGFDFEGGGSFGESDLLAPLTDDELAQETILDPKGASGYDVSSSDLRESPLAAAVAPEPPAVDPTPPPPSNEATVMMSPRMSGATATDPAVVGADLFSDDVPVDRAPPNDPGRETVLASPEPAMDDSSLDAMVPAAPIVPPAPEEPIATREPMAAPPEPESNPEPFAEPVAAPEPMPVAAPEPVSDPEPAPEVFAAPEPAPPLQPTPASEPTAPEAASHDAAGLAGIALAELEPRLREQLHDTLEKIAWEAMGDVAEQIVRQAVERVERVAWEVIPQMAETMIREEIRKLKGDSS
jgi:CheY-like chemotaxis protein